MSSASPPEPPLPLDPAPYHLARGLACGAVSLLLGVTQGLGVNLVGTNLAQLQGTFGATPTEGAWLLSAYYAVNVSSALLLVKFRQQYGFRLFAELGLGLFVIVTAAHLLTNDLRSAIMVRAAQGFAAAPLSTLALFYMFDAFPAAKRPMALALGVASSQIALPLSRVIAPDLLQIGQWHGLYLPELGLALLSLAAVNLVRLTPTPKAPAFDRLDFLSFALFAPGLGLLCIVLGQGRFVWWTESPWLGICLAAAILLLTLAVAIELNRDRPLIHFQWLSTSEMARLAVAIILFRIVLSEQSVGAIGLLQTLGLSTEQLTGMSWVILAATLGGFVCAAFVLTVQRARLMGLAALLLIAAGALLDASVTSLSRPPQMYLSQGLMAFASAFFLPAVMLTGLVRALKLGPSYIVTFIAVFSGGQSLGGLLGSSLLGSFVVVREKFHSNQITQGLSLADPQVAARIRQLAGSYAHTLTDAALRSAEGAALLAQQATREANVLAYADLFRLIAAIALATFAWFAFIEIRERLFRGPQPAVGVAG